MIITENSQKNLLIATVGGSSAPIAESIKHWAPTRTIFVASAATQASINTDSTFNGRPSYSILTLLDKAGIKDMQGRYDTFVISDPQDYAGLVREMRKLDDKVSAFRSTYPESKIVVDFTGGTKAMSAALALVASRWENSQVSYVGGKERHKGGVGVVADGSEQVFDSQNPMVAMGYMYEEQARTLFNQGQFFAARELLKPAYNVAPSSRKEELHALIVLCQAFEAWDSFQHEEASKQINNLFKNWNNLPLQTKTKNTLKKWLEDSKGTLELLRAGGDGVEKRKALAEDILSNAFRRIRQGARDDAVARLYRATEALAQAILYKHDVTETGAVPLDQVPEELRGEWSRKSKDGLLKLGLQDSFALLAALGDETGKAFCESNLADPEKSPLVTRNNSILAHGFQPVSEKAVKALLNTALELFGKTKDDLTTFPEI